MKAQETRIGNLVNYVNGGIFKVTGIHEFGLDVEDEIETTYMEYENFEPIPLTEEWLLKFGFEVYEFDHKANQYRHGNRLLVIRDENCFYDYGADILVKYVHQLQNLYFALTGEELEVKQ